MGLEAVDDGCLHVIVSTGSGTGEAQAFWDTELRSTLNDDTHLPQPIVHITDSDKAISHLVDKVFFPVANKGKHQIVVLLSGDGGVVDIVNGLLANPRSKDYRKPSLVLCPLGTGNALATSAGITRDSSLSKLVDGTATSIPVFEVMFSPGAKLLVDEARQELDLRIVDNKATVYGVVVCSWGLHAGLVADSDTAEYRRLGSERFQIAAKQNLFPSDGSEAHHYKGKVKVLRSGDKDWHNVDRQEHAYVLATTCSHLEKGFTISPASKPLDGKLRLVHFGALGGNEVMEIMGAAYQGGKHIDDARVGYEEIGGLRIDFNEDDARWRRVCVDGTIIRVEKGGWVEVRMGPKDVLDLVL